MNPKEFHDENSEELLNSMKSLKEKAKKLYQRAWIMHALGSILFISSIVYGKHLAAFIIYILLMPDVDDLAQYMRRIYGPIRAS